MLLNGSNQASARILVESEVGFFFFFYKQTCNFYGFYNNVWALLIIFTKYFKIVKDNISPWVQWLLL